MKFKKIISIILIMSIILSCISPISLAAYEYGPDGVESWSVPVKECEWYHESSSDHTSATDELYIKPIEIKVTQDGVYQISNLHGGDSTNFIICLEKDGNLAPLPVATYGNDSNGLKLGKYNSTSQNSASVYLKSGETYQVLLIGETTSGPLRN